MATQQIPESYDSLVQLFEDAATGARDHGVSVGLKHNTEAVLRLELEALTGTAAAPGLKAKWNNAKTYKVQMTAGFRSAKDKGRALAGACVNLLKLRLGGQWNTAWQAAGFSGGSLAIPDNPLVVLQNLRAYFQANPSHEIPDLGAGIGATAAACDAAVQTINTAAAVSNQSNVSAGAAKNQYDAGLRSARKRLSLLREELAQFLGRDDERWYAFGFDRPGDPETPEVPEHLVVTPGAAGSGLLFVDWDNSRRAESYRIVLAHAATGETVVERLVTESEAAFTGLASGQALRIRVSARNARGGESATAPEVAAVVP